MYGFAAYVMWGFFPLYFPLLKPSGPVEILAQRIMWSLVAVLALLAVRRHWGWVRVLGRRKVGLLVVAGAVVTCNWGTFIFGVNTGRTLEASLGYFITPLLSVLFGVVLFRERLSRGQWLAIGLGATAVLVLTVDYGRPPWVALILAVSMGTYGLIKKYAATPSAESLAVETAGVFPLALAAALYLEFQGKAAFGHHGPAHAVLVAGTGVVTALPLMLFNAAAIRVPLSTIGTLQYLTPVLQFLIGLLIQHEAMPPSRWIGFLLVWAALLTFAADGLHKTRTRNAERTEPQPVRLTT